MVNYHVEGFDNCFQYLNLAYIEMLRFPEERALTGPDCHVECALFNFGVLKNAMAQAGEITATLFTYG